MIPNGMKVYNDTRIHIVFINEFFLIPSIPAPTHA